MAFDITVAKKLASTYQNCSEKNRSDFHICPRCGYSDFLITAHVLQTWKVDALGNFVEIVPSDNTYYGWEDDDLWVCEHCNEVMTDDGFVMQTYFSYVRSGMTTTEAAQEILRRAKYERTASVENILGAVFLLSGHSEKETAELVDTLVPADERFMFVTLKNGEVFKVLETAGINIREGDSYVARRNSLDWEFLNCKSVDSENNVIFPDESKGIHYPYNLNECHKIVEQMRGPLRR